MNTEVRPNYLNSLLAEIIGFRYEISYLSNCFESRISIIVVANKREKMSEAIKKIDIGYRCMKEKLNIRSNRIEIVKLIIFMSRQLTTTTILKISASTIAVIVVASLLIFNIFSVSFNVAEAAPPKYVLLHFDDGYKSIYNKGRPIFEKYDIKTTQYIICGYVGKSTTYMTWDNVETLIEDDHSIQSHTMTHPHLPTLTDSQLDYQLKECKSILQDHDADVTTLGIPFNDGEDDERVVKAISKYYESAKGRGGVPFPVNCGSNCKVYNTDGSFNVKSRYAINQWSHDSYSQTHDTDNEIYQGFVKAVNTGQVDAQGNLVKVPIIVYHRVGEGGNSVSQSLLDREMKYLKNNGFTTLTMDDIEYNPTTNRFQLD